MKTTVRSLWKNLQVSKPCDDIPVLFLDVAEIQERRPILSWTNQEQVDATTKISEVLQPTVSGQIAIVASSEHSQAGERGADVSGPFPKAGETGGDHNKPVKSAGKEL